MPARRWFGELWWIATLALSLAVTAWIVFVGEGIDAYYRSRLVDMVHGTAYRPYVYRVFVPGLAHIGSLVMPAAVSNALTSAFERWPGRPAGWPPAYAANYVLVVAIMAASLMGFAAGVRRFSRAVFSAPPIVHATTALAAVAALPLTFGPFSRQIYDFTTLCFFAWCLALMIERRWIAFGLAFAAATLNKESSILLTLVYLVFVARSKTGLSRAAAAGLFVYQLAVVALVRAWVVSAFRDNPGEAVEVHLFGHNQYVLLHPSEMSLRLLMLIGIAIVGVWSWKAQPAPLQQAFAVLAPALLVMGLTVGVIDEIRAFYEIYPLLVLMAGFTIYRAVGVPVERSLPRVGTVGASA